jgi:NAD(P)-dependent dehydrogenase (short-subunit alcohol dehydrogenase family)
MASLLISGCSSGIGRALALHFARRGDTVHATMRTPEEDGDPLRRAARDEGLALHVHAMDVTDDDSVAAAVEMVAREDPVDVLVNNAGVAWLGSLEESPVEWLERTLAVNVVGLTRVTRAVLPSMRERGAGVVANVGSVAGRIASAIQSHYCASKYAVEGLTEALAQEVARFGIRVILLEPGFVATPILEKAVTVPDGSLEGPYAELTRRRVDFFRTGRQRAVSPQEVARVLEEALADDSRRLRWFVGEGGRKAVENREAMSDEEWIALGRLDDDAYAAEMSKRFD